MYLRNIAKIGLIVGGVSLSYLYGESISYDFDAIEDDSSYSSTRALPQSMSQMQQRIFEQDERIDGLITVIDGLSASLNTLGASNHQNTDEVLKKLARMIDEINNNYVSRKELNALLVDRPHKSKMPISTSKKSSGQSLKNKSNATLYSEGVKHFVKQRYSQAKERFLVTAKKGYKPAASNYYLGEVAYYTNEPSDAIFYFKKSNGLFDNASYMDTLLLHTAISLAKIGEKEQARAFYENIIETYPDKKTAKIASKKLKKL